MKSLQKEIENILAMIQAQRAKLTQQMSTQKSKAVQIPSHGRTSKLLKILEELAKEQVQNENRNSPTR